MRTPEEMRAYLDEHYPELSEEAKQAYIDEHHEVCAWCGQTREWHAQNAVRDHAFDPTLKLAYVERDGQIVVEQVDG